MESGIRTRSAPSAPQARPRVLRLLKGIGFLVGCSPVFMRGQAVRAREGDVYYEDSLGRTRQMTAGGADSDPALSPDGRHAIFVRATTTPCGFEEPRNANPVRTQLWEQSTEPNAAPRLLFGGTLHAWRFDYCTFLQPQFAPDGRHAYFLIPLAATSNAIVKIDTQTGTVREMSREFGPVILYHVVGGGRYAGDLVVQKRIDLPEGTSELFWLADPEGRQIGYVGETEAEARAFLQDPNRRLRER